jgi:outer membrane protein TolC
MVIPSAGQKPLLLSEAIQKGLQNYQNIQAKRNYLNASAEQVLNTKKEYLPNLIASLQQDYGTANGQFGPFSPYGTSATSTAGPVYSSQNWNAAFGSAYILNTNWEVFTFGRLPSKIHLAETQVKKDSADLLQEQFVQSVKIAGAYLNLLVAQTLVKNAEANLARTKYIQEVVLARTKTGLNAGVDSSIANAEVSKARLLIIDAVNTEQQFSNQLAQLINISPAKIIADSSFLINIPSQLTTPFAVEQNPQVKYYQSRIDQSNSYADYLSKSVIPGINLFGIFQSRGSGFDYNYTPAGNAGYSKSYFTGLNPVRSNYVAGVSIAWNITSISKIKHQVTAQKFISKAFQNEYDLVSTQLKDQLVLSDQRIDNSLKTWKEVPIQYKAASDAYLQKSVLYKNGLANIVDLQQALYVVNRAETDLSVAYINVWQSLLLKIAASGDFDLFAKQIK